MLFFRKMNGPSIGRCTVLYLLFYLCLAIKNTYNIRTVPAVLSFPRVPAISGVADAVSILWPVWPGPRTATVAERKEAVGPPGSPCHQLGWITALLSGTCPAVLQSVLHRNASVCWMGAFPSRETAKSVDEFARSLHPGLIIDYIMLYYYVFHILTFERLLLHLNKVPIPPFHAHITGLCSLSDLEQVLHCYTAEMTTAPKYIWTFNGRVCWPESSTL